MSEIWRYPVKSMLGERCSVADLQERGVEGDRLFAIRDAAGKLGSGKASQRFSRIRGLLGFEASYKEGEARIRFPSGEVVMGDAPGIDRLLSRALEQPVALVREQETSHMDAAAIHMITSASLAWARRELPEANWDVRRFRPNLVISLPGAQPVEQSWIGRRLRIGEEVELLVTEPTKRCVMVNTCPRGILPRMRPSCRG